MVIEISIKRFLVPAPLFEFHNLLEEMASRRISLNVKERNLNQEYTQTPPRSHLRYNFCEPSSNLCEWILFGHTKNEIYVGLKSTRILGICFLNFKRSINTLKWITCGTVPLPGLILERNHTLNLSSSLFTYSLGNKFRITKQIISLMLSNCNHTSKGTAGYLMNIAP